ncbi:MAG: hypothetical protein K9K39_06535 [Desulfohalobiaceae bacterium]|nr:hypothetical protein [Desulfohalobiaceae bacterium]
MRTSFCYFAIVIPLLLSIAFLVSCTPYKSQQVSFRPPGDYENVHFIAGAKVAAESYADEDKARESFGFNIRKAGLLPVQVVINNTGEDTLQVVPGQTFLIDEEGNYWNLLDKKEAYTRLQKSDEYSRLAKGSGKGAVLGGVGGAIVGSAIGILTGQNIGETAGKGAAVGGAGGAVIGGAQTYEDKEPERRIARDLEEKDLENKQVEPGILGRGFLFFPGEAPSASRLRLQLQDVESGKLHNMVLNL